MKRIFFILLISSFSLSLLAYPITPRPLRKLIRESENIIWARVIEIGSTKSNKKHENIWERDFALIQINEILKGDLRQETVKVYFCSGMICPAPGVFYEGEEVLTFINRREKADGFEVHALSYGVKHGLSQQGYEVYKTRIKEMMKLEDECDLRKKDEQTLEWLVKCAEQPVTRWEGVYELSPQSDFMSFYDREGSERKDIFLTTSQRQRLFDALFGPDTLEYPDLALIDIVQGINDAAILGLLKKGLLNVDRKYIWRAHGIMERIVWLTRNDELEKLMEKFEKVYFSFNEKEQKEANQLLSLFINKMKSVEIKQKLVASDDSDS